MMGQDLKHIANHRTRYLPLLALTSSGLEYRPKPAYRPTQKERAIELDKEMKNSPPPLNKL